MRKSGELLHVDSHLPLCHISDMSILIHDIDAASWARSTRETAGLLRSDAGERAGLSAVTVRNFETGRFGLEAEKAWRLARVLAAAWPTAALSLPPSLRFGVATTTWWAIRRLLRRLGGAWAWRHSLLVQPPQPPCP